MKRATIILFLILSTQAFSQKNFLGRTQKYIEDFYAGKEEYYIKIDTLSKTTILLTFKSIYQYPYYTYEIEFIVDKCISFGLVSKNRDLLETYIDLLTFWGELIQEDEYQNSKIYKLEKDDILRYYIIKQPYINDENAHRRKLFYVLIREKEIIEDF